MSRAPSLAPEQCLARFGLSNFRLAQRDVIDAVLNGEDCLCIMPTGGGKSLCYQLPSVAREGVTLVISPLIALMKDQVDALASRGIRATFINSSLAPADQQLRLEQMSAGDYDLMYVAPERLRSPRFLEAVRRVPIQLLAVDEAHCVSEWGHDFRPDYARLGRFRQRLGNPQTIALTATATPEVREDIARMLDLRSPRVFVSGFARENLRFEVRDVSNGREKDAQLLEFLRENPGAGIIYASSRKRCEEVCRLIADSLRRNVGVYHAGMLPADRRQVQEDFMANRLQIITATNAFGMGIDKSDLRFVVHYNLPGTLEAYYQEAGRAGRDGLPSRCLLLYTYQDRYIQEFFIDNGYPSREVVAAVYRHLCSLEEDPIEITLEDLKERLELPIGAEGVGACERLLEKAGVLERLDSAANCASVRIDSDLPTLVDLLPREARTQEKVLRQVERIVGDRRGERVYFHPQRLAAAAALDREAMARALRELNKLQCFDYVPPFRGRAMHMLDRSRRFDELAIDFEELARRRQAEYAKLERVIRYARTRRCRQLEILEYFGDPNRQVCGNCDGCSRQGRVSRQNPPSVSLADDPQLVRTVRIALSGVARAGGRFGKTMVAQMLCGSKATKLLRSGLHRLSTFGLLRELGQTEVLELLEALLAAGLIEQHDIERHRPIVRLTETGGQVMREQQRLPASFALGPELLLRLCGPSGARQEAASAEEASGRAAPAESRLPPPDAQLMNALRTWRRVTAAASQVPAYRVLTNAALALLAVHQPSDLDGLLEIKGVGKVTVRLYGRALLELIAQHRDGPAGGTPPGGEQEAASHEPADSYWPEDDRGFATQEGEDAGSVAGDEPAPADWDEYRELADQGELPADSWSEDWEDPGAKVVGEASVLSNEPGDRGTGAAEYAWREQADGEPSAAAVPSTATSLPEPARRLEQAAVQPSFYWTWRLLWDGFDVEQCKRIRRLDDLQVLAHLLQAEDHGLASRVEWVLQPGQLKRLAQVVGDRTPRRLRPLLEQLPGLRLEHLQLYLKCREGGRIRSAT